MVSLLVVSHEHQAVSDAPPAAPTSLTVTASQDTEVRATNPGSAYGNRTVLADDSEPVRQSFLKFPVSGIGDSIVTRVRLRMYNLDSSAAGGRVFAMTSTGWPEYTTTWDNRPAVDGPLLGAFGSVTSGSWFEVDLPVTSVSDGTLSLALDSTNTDGALWGSRESDTAPALVIDIAPAGTPPPKVISVAASQDTEVRASNPDSAYGNRTVLAVDGDPVRQTFLTFPVSGIGDSAVTRVRLRMFNVDASKSGGRVFAMSSGSWPEYTTTWNNRPAVDGVQLGAYGAVASGSWYDVDLPVSSVADGTVSLALDSTNTDGAQWASRESGTAPTLVIEASADGPPPPPQPTLTQAAEPSVGSSDPTFYANNHHLARTPGGRLLTVYGRHATGVQLAWQDPGRQWATATTGSVADGLLLSGTGTGDWPASIAVVGDPTGGSPTAVVAWSGQNFGRARPLQMRVLRNLDALGGPDVGPLVTLTAPPLGAARADLGVEVDPAGAPRVAVTWTERTSESSYALKVGWLDDHLAAQPLLVAQTVLLEDKAGSKPSTIATTPEGVRVAARAASGRLRVYGHDSSAPPTSWWSTPLGASVPSGAFPSAIGLPSGDVLVTSSRDLTRNIVTVQRFTGPEQPPTTELEITGYKEPNLATDGTGARLVAVRTTDGYVVSRYGMPGAGWEATDRVAIGPEGGGNHSWPSAVGSPDGGLRLVVRGPGPDQNHASVLAYVDPRPGG